MTNDLKPIISIPKLAVSSLASGSFYNCEKHYYLLSKPLPKKEYDLEISLRSLQLERGITFEDRLFQKHKLGMVDHTYSKDFRKVLQEAQSGQYLYQLRFTLPEEFYADVIGDTETYRMKSFIPDFLYIHEDSTTKVRKILIIDAKSSKNMSDTHQFQVGSYAFFLEYLIKDIRNLEVDRLGGVWLPSDIEKPELFRIDLMISKIKMFYKEEMINILKFKNPEWHLAKRCITCPFSAQCKEDSKGTIRSLPHMNTERLTRIREDTLGDIEDLADLMNNMNLNDTSKDSFDVRQYVESYQYQRPQFLGRASVLTAKEVDYTFYISLSVDTYSEKPFAYAVYAFDFQKEAFAETYFDYVHATYKELEKNDCPAYCKFVESFINSLTCLLQSMGQKESRCLFYVYRDAEKDKIYKFLYNLVASGGKHLTSLDSTRVKEIIEDSMKCLVSLFQDTQLLGLPGSVVFPDMEDIQRTSSVGRFVSIESLLEENIALPTPGYYEFPEAAKWMTKTYNRDDDNAKRLEDEYIHGCWLKNNYNDVCCAPDTRTVERSLQDRFFCLHEIMDTYWNLANEYMSYHNLELFPLVCKPFKWPVVASFKNPVLAKLVFFKQIECITTCDSQRKDRITDLATWDNKSTIQSSSLILEFISETRIDKFEVNIQFKVITTGDNNNEKLDRLVMSDFQQYILVPNDRDSIISAIKFSDPFYMATTKYQKKPIVCVNVVDVDVHNNVITINKQGKLGRVATTYRLYRRYIDFTTPKAVDSLKRMDKEAEYKDIVKLIEDPNTWSNTNIIDHINFNMSFTAKRLRDAFSMSPSQKAITDNILKKRLQIVWGPPGSGKTEFLSLFINWYIKCFVDHNGPKDLLIGITAFTNDAIINLLKRVESIQKRHGFKDLFSIIFATYRDDPKPGNSNIIHVKWQESITAVNKLKKNNGIRIFVLGTTVYSWNNIKDKWKTFKGCDMLIIDESSQLLVSDALLAIKCLSQPHGKLIVAGDHMQLGPILGNDYSSVTTKAEDPLLYGSIQQCLMRTEDNLAISTRSFVLGKDSTSKFGPNTLQLKDNWRMNEELNLFFQQVYGPDFISRYPKLVLHLNENLINDNLIKSILDPSRAFSLVNVKIPECRMHNILEEEANIVHRLVTTYLKALRSDTASNLIPISKEKDEPKVMVVAPYVKQCVAIKRKLSELSEDIPVGTVEKMQGQQCDLIIACYTCKLKTRQDKFLIDFKRWNVTLSRARCKVIILAIDNLFDRNVNAGMMESFSTATSEPADGWSFLCLLKQWANERKCAFTWDIEE